MASAQQSPTNTRYFLSVPAPQAVAMEAMNLQDMFRRKGVIPAPMSPLLPLLETDDEPRPPVTGRLPRCPVAPRVSPVPVISRDGRWWILPVDSGGWFEDLTAALSEWAGMATGSRRFYTAFEGIPLAAIPGDGETTYTMADARASADGPAGFAAPVSSKSEDSSICRPTPGWRALNLQCHEVKWETSRPWFMGLQWRMVWTRRLSRAPASGGESEQTNISK